MEFGAEAPYQCLFILSSIFFSFIWNSDSPSKWCNLKSESWTKSYSSAPLFTTPAGGALPARSGSGEMSKLKHRAQPRSVTWKGKELSNRSTPASTPASTSSGRPTPCSSLRVTHKHTHTQERQKAKPWIKTNINVTHTHTHINVNSILLLDKTCSISLLSNNKCSLRSLFLGFQLTGSLWLSASRRQGQAQFSIW